MVLLVAFASVAAGFLIGAWWMRHVGRVRRLAATEKGGLDA
ncbi:hypothetical protein [Actinocorallia sp. API 0066]|nr:hypothetical protein [Actinocorallia sp. API 0066]